MLRSVRSLYGCPVRAIDGIVGKVHELYFVDDSWDIAYVVVRLGGLIGGQKKLIPPDSIGGVTPASTALSVWLKKEQILALPGPESDLPVSLLRTMILREYYELPAVGYGAGTLPSPGIPPPLTLKEQHEIASLEQRMNPHLRRTREVARYCLRLKDGTHCRIRDIIMEDASWRIAYFATVTGGWIRRCRVFVSASSISEIRWGQRVVAAELAGDTGTGGRSLQRFPRVPMTGLNNSVGQGSSPG